METENYEKIKPDSVEAEATDQTPAGNAAEQKSDSMADHKPFEADSTDDHGPYEAEDQEPAEAEHRKVLRSKDVKKDDPADQEKGGQKEDETGDSDQRRTKQIGALIFGIVMLLCLIGLLLLYILGNLGLINRGGKIRTEALRPDIAFDAPDDLKELITDNYVQYLNKAYVLFGTYPDCSYFKVEPGVARDDYDFEHDFYVADGEEYLNYYKDGQKAGRVGVDVSEYQEEIDWTAVKASGVEVAILRAGFRGYGAEGNMKKDAYFDTNMQGALAAGLDVGVYFFSEAVSYEEGVEEAELVLSMVKPYSFRQPIIIDTEKVGDEEGRANLISVEERTEALLGFCETVEAAGYTPMIYASTYWFVDALDLSKLGKYEFWLAAYDTPQFPYHVEGWQYASDGYVPGISGNVDMNVWLR